MMMKNRKKMIAAAAALSALVLFAGCTTASAVSLEEAKDLVQKTVGVENALVVEQETDRDDGVYELEIIVDGVSYEFEVDSRTGEVREAEREDDLTTAQTIQPTQPAQPTESTQPIQSTQPRQISLEEARAIAFAHAGVSGEDVYDRSAEMDDGLYEIDFEYDGWDYEYDIARDGTVIRAEKDRDDDHHDGHHQDHHTAGTASAIGADRAWSIALERAGVTEARDREVEWDDGCWEVSFESGSTEYDCRISADGTILSFSTDIDD